MLHSIHVLQILFSVLFCVFCYVFLEIIVLFYVVSYYLVSCVISFTKLLSLVIDFIFCEFRQQLIFMLSLIVQTGLYKFLYLSYVYWRKFIYIHGEI